MAGTDTYETVVHVIGGEVLEDRLCRHRRGIRPFSELYTALLMRDASRNFLSPPRSLRELNLQEGRQPAEASWILSRLTTPVWIASCIDCKAASATLSERLAEHAPTGNKDNNKICISSVMQSITIPSAMLMKS